MSRTIAAAFAALLMLASGADADTDARAVLDAWLAAQNAGRYADYEALYAPAFRGVRRSGGKAVELDRAGWLKDRQRMFKRPMKVTVDKLQAEPQADGAHLTFMQTFESGSYADVGEKELVVAAGLIVREELRSSSRLQPAAADASCDTLACKKATPDGQRAIVEACVKSCDDGDMSGCRQRANMFHDGICGVAKDEAQAAAFYEKGCLLKDDIACTLAAQILASSDPKHAAVLLEKACSGDEEMGCYAFALVLRDGKGIARDVKRAIEIMDHQCRENGRSGAGTNSCSELETMYRDGTGGVKKDRALAREYRQLYKEATSGE